jgi:hypothetical protein
MKHNRLGRAIFGASERLEDFGILGHTFLDVGPVMHLARDDD